VAVSEAVVIPGNWGVTAGAQIEWLYVAVLENSTTPEALANGPLVNDTVTGAAHMQRSRLQRT